MKRSRLSMLLLPALAAALLSAEAGGQAVEEWVATYDGPGHGGDVAKAIALAPDGGVCVTGMCYGGADPASHANHVGTAHDYTTIKYDQYGSEEWVARYCGPESGDTKDDARAIAVDGDGNVYVTGASDGGGAGRYGETWDYATVKYDSVGNEEWVARYDGPANGKDEAVAIALDDDGNVYVTGLSLGIGTLDDYATVKYSPDGLEEWVARYDGPTSGFDWVRDIAVDDEANVYVTGATKTAQLLDYATVKYDRYGEQMWVATYHGPEDGDDQAYALALDADGNVYVTGQSWGGSYGSGTCSDYVTIKYNPGGREEWVARYNGPGTGSQDYARDIAVDAAGNVCVTGLSSGMWTGYDYATIKYVPDGEEEWVVRYDGAGVGIHGTDAAYGVAVDGDGNVYVTGASYLWPADDIVTVMYDSSGAEEWICRYDGPAGSSDYAWDIAADVGGNVYVCGAGYDSTTSSDYTTVKYSSATGVAPDGESGPGGTLFPASPNPFTVGTDIQFDLPGWVESLRLAVYSVRGQLVRTLIDGPADPGRRRISWDGTDTRGARASAGVYFVRLEARGVQSTQKIVLLR